MMSHKKKENEEKGKKWRKRKRGEREEIFD